MTGDIPDFTRLDDSALISSRAQMRAELERLPPYSPDHDALSRARILPVHTPGKAADVMTRITGAAQRAKVGTAVGERMTALGITEDGLVRATALSKATVRGVLRGSGRRQRWTLNVVSHALDRPPGHLITIAEDGTPPATPQTAVPDQDGGKVTPPPRPRQRSRRRQGPGVPDGPGDTSPVRYRSHQGDQDRRRARAARQWSRPPGRRPGRI